MNLEGRLRKLEQQRTARRSSKPTGLSELTAMLRWLGTTGETPEDALAHGLQPPPPMTRAQLARLVKARADVAAYRQERFPDGIVLPVVAQRAG